MNEQKTASQGELLPSQTEVPECFGCGQGNPSGLKLKFRKESPTKVSTNFIAPKDWTGWGKILHGGFHALLLDEITAWVPFGLMNDRSFLTKEITVSYRKPAYVEQPLYISAELLEDAGREIRVKGKIYNQNGDLLSEATSLLVRVKSI